MDGAQRLCRLAARQLATNFAMTVPLRGMQERLVAGALSRQVADLLVRFDGSYRTAEAHGAGILRKTSFTWTDVDRSPYIDLLGFWNVLDRMVAEVCRLMDDARLDPEAYVPT